MGDGSDLIIQHNGTNSFIDNNTGDLYLQTTGSGDDVYIESVDDIYLNASSKDAIHVIGDGAVEIFHNDIKRLSTTAIGATVFGDFIVAGVTTAEALNITGVSTFNGLVSIGDSINHIGDTDTAIRFPTTDAFSVETAGSEAIRVDSSQRLLIGHAASRAVGNVTSQMQLEGTDASSGISITRNSNNASGPYISLAKSRGGAVGGTTVVADGDAVGSILFSGADGTDITNNAASIAAYIDATPGGNDTPGRLVFSTTADGGTSPTERLRITSDGYVGINTTDPRFNQEAVTSGIKVNDEKFDHVLDSAKSKQGVTDDSKLNVESLKKNVAEYKKI